VAEVAMAHGADVLHCHQYSPFVYGQLSAWLSRRLRVIYTEHGRLSDAPPSLKRRMANPILQLRQVQICAVSEELRSHMHQWGFKQDRVRVVYNGVDPGPDLEPRDRVRARALLDLPPGIPVIGTVARLDPVKQLGTLIDAFALLVHRLPAARLVIVGDGPERAALEERIRAHGLGGAVLLSGHRDDARRLLPGFDLFVNCSITEGVSLTLLEAMAACVPVVATRVGGTPEVVMEGGTGCLVPPRAPMQLAYAIASLFADEPRRELMGRAARRRMVERFTLDGMVEAYAGLYTGGEN
jgi:glycosyltransferase involved in cell wall biosynthesis